MNAYAWVGVIGLVAATGCWEGMTGVKGSGNAKTEARKVDGFSAVDVSGSVHVELAIAAQPSVEVSGDDNLVAMIDTQVHGDVLSIGNHGNMRPVVPLVVRVSATRIAKVTASGATTVAVHGVHGDQLAITVEGAATLRGDGAVHQLTVDTSGAGTLDLEHLTAERASVKASGSGTVTIDVTQALDADVSGAGTVNYHGNPPDVKKDVSGAGSLVKR
jgi:hypothetical protein